jgi:hypothetical protein
MKDARERGTSEVDATPTPLVSDDPAVLATQARESVEKSAAEIRNVRVRIETEPPTVYRP